MEGRHNPFCLLQLHGQFLKKMFMSPRPTSVVPDSFSVNYSYSVMSVTWKSWHAKHGTIKGNHYNE